MREQPIARVELLEAYLAHGAGDHVADNAILAALMVHVDRQQTRRRKHLTALGALVRVADVDKGRRRGPLASASGSGFLRSLPHFGAEGLGARGGDSGRDKELGGVIALEEDSDCPDTKAERGGRQPFTEGCSSYEEGQRPTWIGKNTCAPPMIYSNGR